jgi:hypothetical protein
MLKVSLQPTLYSPVIAEMQRSSATRYHAPKGLFYNLAGVVSPYTLNPTVLRIETDRINEAIEIQVAKVNHENIGLDQRSDREIYTVVATSGVITVPVQLGRGENRITAQVLGRTGDVDYLIVYTSTIVALWESFVRVLYQNSLKIINEQKTAVSSKLATRLLEAFISFQDLLPDVQSLQILAMRLLTRGMVHGPGSSSGVTDMVKALNLTTPVYKNMDKDTFEINPSLDPWARTSSQFGGNEAHVWIPNVGIASWLAFLGYINNQPDLFDIISVSEEEVVVRFQGELQRHRFDFDLFGTDFLSSLARSDCFKSVTISVGMRSQMLIVKCAPAYTFDLFVPEDKLLGNSRSSFDIDVPFDSDLPFDSDDVDPFTDGWLGLSLTGRFEQDYPQQYPLDTFVMPSTQYTGSVCGYEGHYSQVVENQNFQLDVDATFTADGWVQTAIPFTLESPDNTRWDIIPDENGQLVAISGSARNPDNYKVTKPDLSEIAFAITNEGFLQTVPVSGGETLRDDLYVKGTGGFIWDINVNNANVIFTDKIFP